MISKRLIVVEYWTVHVALVLFVVLQFDYFYE